MAKRDYYEVLSVDQSADEATLKKSYRRLAMKYHPDRNVGDAAGEAEAKFKEAKEAYDVLSDGQKRALYDQYGHAGLEQQGGGRSVVVQVTLAISLTTSLAAVVVVDRIVPIGVQIYNTS